MNMKKLQIFSIYLIILFKIKLTFLTVEIVSDIEALLTLFNLSSSFSCFFLSFSENDSSI